jgi:dTDP-4-dehydrorhamnose 3,5-epimerase
MEVESLSIPDVKLVKPRVFSDARGFFQQCYHEQQYREQGIDITFRQDNWSHSIRGVLRGLHYQLSRGQDKLIYVISGRIFDVAVDIRRGSPTFGKWTGASLSEENHHQLYIPKGFAHGFCVLSDEVDIVYKCSDFYSPADERSVHWNDPDIRVEWPDANYLVSEKDRKAPFLRNLAETDLPAS